MNFETPKKKTFEEMGEEEKEIEREHKSALKLQEEMKLQQKAYEYSDVGRVVKSRHNFIDRISERKPTHWNLQPMMTAGEELVIAELIGRSWKLRENHADPNREMASIVLRKYTDGLKGRADYLKSGGGELSEGSKKLAWTIEEKAKTIEVLRTPLLEGGGESVDEKKILEEVFNEMSKCESELDQAEHPHDYKDGKKIGLQSEQEGERYISNCIIYTLGCSVKRSGATRISEIVPNFDSYISSL